MATQVNDRDDRRDESVLRQPWHGWGSPVGLGLGLVLVAGFFWVLALGLSVLSSIG